MFDSITSVVFLLFCLRNNSESHELDREWSRASKVVKKARNKLLKAGLIDLLTEENVDLGEMEEEPDDDYYE
jgi:hypothetical protein